jgi:formylmethanofuran dehydrogenase subunit E
LQYLSGCTFGKGNLIFRDYGKQVYTLYDRKTKRGVRVVFNARQIPEDVSREREGFVTWLLSVPDDSFLSLSETHVDEPEPARIMKSIECAVCGEMVMETRTKKINGGSVCIPCAEKKAE